MCLATPMFSACFTTYGTLWDVEQLAFNRMRVWKSSQETFQVQGDVLDIGADPRGEMLQYMARHVVGNLVGYNLRFPEWRAAPMARVGSNFSMVYGDHGTCLPFRCV